MKKKYASLLLAMSLTACMLSGCGSKDTTDPSKEAKPTQGVSQETIVTQAPIIEDNQEAPVTQEPIVDVPEKYKAPLETVTALKTYKYWSDFSSSDKPTKETSYDYEMDTDGNIVKVKIYSSDITTPTIYTFNYTYFEDGKVQTVTRYKVTRNGELINRACEYDKDGNLIKIAQYSDVSGEEGKVDKGIEYSYNEGGILLQEVSTRFRERGSYEMETKFYEESGRVIKTIDKEVRYDDGEREESEKTSDYTYTVEKTDNGEKVHKFRNGKETSIREYEYDSDGRVVQEFYDNLIEGDSYDELWKYEYNAAGVMIKKTLCYSSRSTFGTPKTVYEYDEVGNLLRESELDYKDGSVTSEYTCNYITVRNWSYIDPLI